MKTFDKKDVFSWANCEDAKQYIGKEGYFSDDLDELNREINENKLYPLKEVNSNSAICFVTLSPVGRWSCGLFLPADKIKEVEKPKKWRAFKYFADFLFTTKSDVGNTICYRNKKELNVEIVSVINGFGVNADNELQFVELGGLRIEPDALFEFLEFQNEDKEWRPFGVEE